MAEAYAAEVALRELSEPRLGPAAGLEITAAARVMQEVMGHLPSLQKGGMPMPKMHDSRRKKIQARQRQLRAAQSREKKAARRAQKAGKGAAAT